MMGAWGRLRAVAAERSERAEAAREIAASAPAARERAVREAGWRKALTITAAAPVRSAWSAAVAVVAAAPLLALVFTDPHPGWLAQLLAAAGWLGATIVSAVLLAARDGRMREALEHVAEAPTDGRWMRIAPSEAVVALGAALPASFAELAKAAVQSAGTLPNATVATVLLAQQRNHAFLIALSAVPPGGWDGAAAVLREGQDPIEETIAAAAARTPAAAAVPATVKD